MNAPAPMLVVLAAGMSTRYGRLKQLDRIGPSGEALMDYGIHDAWRAGVRRIAVVVREEIGREVIAHVRALVSGAMDVVSVLQRMDDLPGELAVADRERPWGTGHALWCCRAATGTAPFLVMNADDFYGRSAFERLIAWARDPADAVALVPYRLDATLSASGGVSRAICHVDDGRLVSIDEVLDVRRTADGIIGQSPAGSRVTLRGDALCSMNLWGFTSAAHTGIERGLVAFLKTNADPTAEYRVPDLVNAGIASRRLTARVLETADTVFGMTHGGDRDAVAARLDLQVSAGVYPTPLATAFR